MLELLEVDSGAVVLPDDTLAEVAATLLFMASTSKLNKSAAPVDEVLLVADVE